MQKDFTSIAAHELKNPVQYFGNLGNSGRTEIIYRSAGTFRYND